MGEGMEIRKKGAGSSDLELFQEFLFPISLLFLWSCLHFQFYPLAQGRHKTTTDRNATVFHQLPFRFGPTRRRNLGTIDDEVVQLFDELHNYW